MATAAPIATDERSALAAARAPRAALRRVSGAVSDGAPVDPADLAPLNRVLAAGFDAIEADPTGRLRTVQRTRGHGPEAALLPVAASARDLLATRDPVLLHRRGNER
ncbi:MAG: hypothetical protein AVDCRST_MAG49-111 [uncultured Thermomicrobiales bacterium]|uniref:Uncharacterized protein n=1 Tax=uncultured Thermomicrobiales bacterium TaxID=1645740 RepID=A0A6J4TVY5_9BACT|nr:MAG: hypothetical protein AVDCRST_MAG49-111 [uncultured Thermomicrobiales bacterium]